MVEADPGFDVGRHDRVDKAVIELQSLFVRPAPSLRKDAGPSGGQTVGADAELAHQRHVLRPAMVMVASDVTVVATQGLAGKVAERIPDRRPAPVLGDGALDLVSGRR